MYRELRRYENRLVVIGTGLTAFGLWTLIKAFIQVFSHKEYITSLLGDSAGDALTQAAAYVIFVILGIFILLIHLFIGFSARAEGFGKKNGIVYLVMTARGMVLGVISMRMNISNFDTNYPTASDGIISLFIDFTTEVTMGELIYAAIRVKLIKRRIKN